MLAAVRPPGTVSVQLVPEQFVDVVQRGWPDIAVLDPLLSHGVGSIPMALRATRTPALLYVCLTPEHARAAIDFLRSMPLPVLTFGYGDDAHALTEALVRSGRATRGATLLEHLAPALERLPKHVSDGIVAANRSHSRVTTAAELASYCGVHPATLARLLAHAALAPASRLLAALGLAQAYDALSNADVPLVIVARRLGVGSVRSLARRCRTASGFTLTELRGGVSLVQFCTACAERLVAA